MIFIQLNDDKAKRSMLVLVLEADNFERMKHADPITLMPKACGGFINPIRYPDGFSFIVAFEDDAGRCYELQNDPQALIRHLSRGYDFTAVDGIRVTSGDKGGAS